jgi:hypothetical protein
VCRGRLQRALTRCAKLDTAFIKARDIRTFGGLGSARPYERAVLVICAAR